MLELFNDAEYWRQQLARQIEDALSQTFYVVQFLLVMVTLDNRSRDSLVWDIANRDAIIEEQGWTVSSLFLFLKSDVITLSKDRGIYMFRLSSAITSSILQLISSIINLGIDVNILRKDHEVTGVIERMLFSCRSNLLIVCGIIISV
jgi:hypothetical protein